MIDENQPELSCLQDVFTYLEEYVGDLNEEVWFRGQANYEWGLKPGIYRGNYSKEVEITYSNMFKSKARIRYQNCPDNNDYLGWLFLAQHYGLNTRLLDWTRQLLTAIYFTVSNKKLYETDGSLFMFYPGLLNESEVGSRSIHATESDHVLGMAEDAFEGSDESINNVIALMPNHFDNRHLVQDAHFTIHGRDVDLTALAGQEEYILKIRIEAKNKNHIYEQLDKLGITRDFLFPDLENLSSFINDTEIITD